MTQLHRPSADARIAILPRPRLGDGLVTMVLAENLRRAGRAVRVHHDALAALAPFFPGHDLRPVPGDASDLTECDLAYAHTEREAACVPPGVARIVGRERPAMRRPLPRAHLYRDLAREAFGVEEPSEECGARRPVEARPRPGRVAIHPESLDPRSVWPRGHFLRLADGLRARGLEPRFVVAPGEAAPWRAALPADELFVDPDLAAVARFLLEAERFVGNDSGLGHLASALGIPTLTLFSRPALAKRWRPHWAPSDIVLPAFSPPSAALQLASWKRLLTPARALRAFDAFAHRSSARSAGTPDPLADDAAATELPLSTR